MKKLISIILCIVMLLSLSVNVLGAEDVKCPIVYVPGIASSDIYTDKDNPTKTITEFEDDALSQAVKEEIVPAFIVYAADRNADKLAKTVSDSLNELFADWFNNPDGTAKGNSGVILRYPSQEQINAAGRLTFSYDWRGDPIEIASQLNDYINYVISTGKYDKVALASHSLGSVIITAYLSIYGYDKVMGVVFDSPSIDGVTYIGELLNCRTEVTAASLSAALKTLLSESEYKDLVSSSLDIFEMAGITDSLSVFLDSALKKIYPTVCKETLVPLFGRWLTIWAMVPQSHIDESMEFVFDNLLAQEDLSVLRGKVEEYNSLVRKNRKETLLEFDKVGRFAVISRYGYSNLPITDSWSLLGDSVVETKSSSLGAVTAAVGECFSDEYLEGKDMKYISPDKTVDASTCLFPEKTWFIKNFTHSDAKHAISLYPQFLFAQEELTCDSSEMPRFTVFNAETESFDTDETLSVKTEKLTPLQRLFNFLRALFEKLADLFLKA